MNELDKARAVEITKDLKAILHHALSKYAAEVSQINKTNSDPHTPIVGTMTMALAQVCTEYLIISGCKANEAVQLTVNAMGHSVNTWINSLQAHAKSKPDVSPSDINKGSN